MKKLITSIIFIFLFLFSFPFISSHQPRIVYDKASIYEIVSNPEISQAFYGELKGTSNYYIIDSSSNFTLYLNILSPNIEGARKDFLFKIFSNSGNYTINGTDWIAFYEEFGGDNYLKGPEFEKNVSAGIYVVEVTNPGNEGRYTLAIGKIESFPLGESVKSVFSIIRIKHEFFNKNYFSFFDGIIGKMVGIILIIFILLLSLTIFLVRRSKRKKKHHKRH